MPRAEDLFLRYSLSLQSHGQTPRVVCHPYPAVKLTSRKSRNEKLGFDFYLQFRPSGS